MVTRVCEFPFINKPSRPSKRPCHR